MRRWFTKFLFPRWALQKEKIAGKKKALQAALADYPLYEPPYRDGFPDPSREGGEANFKHLLDIRTERLSALASLLDRFGVRLSLDDTGLKAVSSWIAEYGGLLIDNFRDERTMEIFYHLSEPWTGRCRGLNVIFDLGIFLAEAMIARKTKMRWARLGGFVILGVSGGKPFEPFRQMYSYCHGLIPDHWSGMPIDQHRAKPDTFFRYVSGLSK